MSAWAAFGLGVIVGAVVAWIGALFLEAIELPRNGR